MQITNLTTRRLTASEFEMAKKTWASEDFIPTEDYWLANFEVDGESYFAGLRKGRRRDVSPGTEQIDIQLRIPDAAFDADRFPPEAHAADVLTFVREEMDKRGWNLP